MYIDIPAKVISCYVTSASGAGAWPYNDGTGDPYWTGGSQPRDYRWLITMSVEEQAHSSHRTRKPKAFTGMDIKVGDYIASNSDGIALKIVSIEAKSDTSVTCVVEDTLRYNTYRYSGGDGFGRFSVPTQAMVFELNEQGMPVVDPVPAVGVGAAFLANLSSRFQNLEQNVNFILRQPSHGFSVGQLISADSTSDGFVPTDSAHPYIVGTVTYANLGPDHFMVNPIQKVLDNFDYLPGNVGDVLYADDSSPGALTLAAGSKPVMIKLRDHTASSVTGTVAGPSTSPGTAFKLNGASVVVGGTGSVQDFIDAVNGGSHGIVASAVGAPTVAETSLSLAYGEPGIFAPAGGPYASARVNGVLVTFTTVAAGQAAYAMDIALEQDMMADINAAGITNIVASAVGNKLVITETSGGPIVIENVSNDSNGTPFAGTNSASGLALTTAASSDVFVRLTAPDSRAIEFYDTTGTPTLDFGLASVENGTKAAALYIEQGIRKASTYVVADVASRDSLSVIIGDHAHVFDKGDGEWGFYLYDGSAWILVASQETAKVDSDIFVADLVHSSAVSGDLGEIGDGCRINFVTVSVLTPFDGAGAAITVGDDGDMARLMAADQNDLSHVGDYTTTPTHTYLGGGDVVIKYSLNAAGSSIGSIRLTVSYN